ncbi:MAG: arginine deiminase family protein [Kiritimatiellae bacterium]|nr:arginine deiminase family protein [Kiritimatiellia bacterium]
MIRWYVGCVLIGLLLSNAARAGEGELVKKSIGVDYEWGTLKEVVVGIGDGLVMPGLSDKVDFIYDKTYLEAMKKTGGKPAIELEPENTRAVIAQINGLVKVLEDQGVTVYRPRVLNPTEHDYLTNVQEGQMQIYARDPMLVIGNNVIETSLKVPMRAKEKFPLREIIRERIKDTDARYVAMPSPNPNYEEDGIYIEGGDVLLNGKNIYVGHSGKGSSLEGIEWLQNYLGPDYLVQEVKVSSDFEHLDCIMALLKPGLGLLCKDALVGELPESLKDWDFINVTVEEAKRLGANALVLNDSTVIMDTQHQRIIEEVRKRGHHVIEVPYDKVATWGGAFRCSHHPLVREGGSE